MVNGRTNKKMVEDDRLILMDLYIKDIGRIISLKVMEGKFILMDKYTKDNGTRVNSREKAYFLNQMELH
jgi:hypothetical protein